jgi:hypothetical protein
MGLVLDVAALLVDDVGSQPLQHSTVVTVATVGRPTLPTLPFTRLLQAANCSHTLCLHSIVSLPFAATQPHYVVLPCFFCRLQQ